MEIEVTQAGGSAPLQILVDGSPQTVTKDTVTSANTIPVPVEIVSAAGVEINVTAGDINVQLAHTGANFDSTRIGDGTTIMAVNTDGSITAQPGALTASGSGAALNATPIASTNVTPYGSAMVHITGTFSGSWLPEVSNNGTDWAAVPFYTAASNISFPSVTPASGVGLYRIPLGVSFFRVRISSYTSGTISASAVFISEAQNGAYMNATRIYSSGGAAMTTGSQAIGNCFAVSAHLTNAAGIVDYGAGASSAQTIRVVQATDSGVKQAGKAAVTRARNDYTSTNVTTGAYVQLVASLSAAVSEIEIFDSSGQTLVLATGAAASEVDQVYVIPGGNGRIPLAIASGARVSIKAVSATANAGEIAINFYGV